MLYTDICVALDGSNCKLCSQCLQNSEIPHKRLSSCRCVCVSYKRPPQRSLCFELDSSLVQCSWLSCSSTSTAVQTKVLIPPWHILPHLTSSPALYPLPALSLVSPHHHHPPHHHRLHRHLPSSHRPSLSPLQHQAPSSSSAA